MTRKRHMTTSIEPWTPPSGRSAKLQPAGRSWDVVRVPLSIGIGKRTLGLLGDTTGAVIQNPFDEVLYWLIAPDSATEWDMTLLPGIQVWGATAYIEVPPSTAGRALGFAGAYRPGISTSPPPRPSSPR
jgi:hypothetical protein